MKPYVISCLSDFAKATVKTHDLDPTYDLIYNMSKEKGYDWTAKVCLYMVMFYDLRTALEAGKLKGAKFWEFIEKNYKTLPRGSERRHFRGNLGWNTFIALRETFPTRPEDFMNNVYDPSLKVMESKMRTFPNFGPYFIWKAADYHDRILGNPINYRDNLALLPDQPRKAATIFFPNLSLDQALDIVATEIKDLPAPGLPNRKCSLSEAETVLCMAKTYFVTKQAQIGTDLMLRWKELGETEYATYLPQPVDVKMWVRG